MMLLTIKSQHQKKIQKLKPSPKYSLFMQQGSMKLNISLIQLGSLFAFISAFLFSSKAIFIKQAYSLTSSLDAITLMAIRMGIALPFF